MEFTTAPANPAEVTLLYSKPGVGKTELAASYPQPLFLMISLERGLETLMKHRRVKNDIARNKEIIDTWDKLITGIRTVAGFKSRPGTLVLDTINRAQALLEQHILLKEFGSDKDAYDSFGKGSSRLKLHWQGLLDVLDWIRWNRGVRILLLAHSTISKIDNPDGDNYQTNAPELNEKYVWNPTNGWADNVFYMDLEVVMVKRRGVKKLKASGGDRRLLYVHSTANHFAKNRFGLVKPVSMGRSGADGYRNLISAIKAIESGQEQPDPYPPEEDSGLPGDETNQPVPETMPPPVETKQAPTETETPPNGKAWVQTWLNRIKAADKIGPAVSTFNDLVTDYSSAVEPDQVEYFPGLFMAWLEHCLSLGGKAAEQVQKKLTGKHDLPIRVIDPLFTRLNQGQAA